jgi:hypothetical protein
MHAALRLLTLPAGALALAVASPSPAAAQKAGTYSGKLANGFPITITVANGSKKGTFEVTKVELLYNNDPCTPGNTVLNGGAAFAPDVTITPSKTTLHYSSIEFYFIATATFSGSTVSGSVISALPAFAAYTTAPQGAVYCPVKLQSYTATLGAPSVIDYSRHVVQAVY